jgi:hypothetical protein
LSGDGSDALVVSADPMFAAQGTRLSTLATRSRFPMGLTIPPSLRLRVD